MLQIQIEKVWFNTIVLRFLPNYRFRWSDVLENPLKLENMFDCLASMFREVFLVDKNEIFLNFVVNL
jgi:hypothetical protein